MLEKLQPVLRDMNKITVGVRACANPWNLEETLYWLALSTVSLKLKVFDWEPAEGITGPGLCLSQLVRECPADFYFLLESGALPDPQSLQAMLDVFRLVPSCGIVGPSTNRGVGEQAIFWSPREDVVRNSVAARLRFGSTYRSLPRNSFLEDFCVGFRHEFLEVHGPVRDTREWLSEFSTQTQAKGSVALWACGAYVHRKSPRIVPIAALSQFPATKPACLAPLVSSAAVELSVNSSETKSRASPLHATEPQTDYRPENSTVADAPSPCRPLVSCIMPTFNRRAFFPRAVHCFLSQNYPHTELVVVDDGTDPIADLLPSDTRVRYFRHHKKQNVGTKRNFACEQAHGEYIFHWDDDEWYGPSRIQRQLEAMQQSKARITGTSIAFFYNESSARAFRYSYAGATANWMGALAYPRHIWKDRPFDCVPIAEDVRFITRIPAGLRLDLKDPTLYVASIHDSNTSPKITTGSYWKPEPLETIHAISGFQSARTFAASREMVA